MSIVINTPTGKVGASLAERLLNSGQKITVIARDSAKVQHLANRGATVVKGSFFEAKTLDAAFKGAKAIFWVTPPANSPTYHDEAVEAARTAAKVAHDHHIHTVVVLSSFGAQAMKGTGLLDWLWCIENEFKAVLPNVCTIRAAMFFENLLNDVATIAAQSTVYSAYKQDLSLPWVATEDVAFRAAAFLTRPFQGHVTVGAHGPQDLTIPQIHEIVGHILGKKINIVPITTDQVVANLKGYGMPEYLAARIGQLVQATNAGIVTPVEARTPGSYTPTTLHEWVVNNLKPAVEAASKK
jgi:uncharacterized protein YbjT (DUF2867 family)